ncbi:hypothetical protein NON00_16415 [Roseomonas sp. GC11]|uniref:hypothetical protein n=1 Tax=Roseomonas sp. GC11 TaxID=2950546 RepID=UPI00210C332F|nr:hypothetical protein [Roseomonas sp. GC11]MCQ4161504.1 hypothetical protein [Roseomonas sp. GC11]
MAFQAAREHIAREQNRTLEIELVAIAATWAKTADAWQAQIERDAARRRPTGRRAAALAAELARLEEAATAARPNGPDDMRALACMVARRVQIDDGDAGAVDTARLLDALLSALLHR